MGMIPLLISLLLVCLIGYVCFWLLGKAALPEPIRIIIAIIIVLVLLSMVYGGVIPTPNWHR